MPGRSDPAIFADPARTRITARVLLVAAHPDDETVALGAQLCRCDDLILLHLTDGAPRDLADARRHGFEDAPSYAAARARELQAALAVGSVSARRFSFGLPDQRLAQGLPELCRRMSALLERLRPELLITHAYEGGHPDHDGAALACQLAARALPAAARPQRLEFPAYHAADGSPGWGRFVPHEAHPEIAIALSAEERRRRVGMLACFTTQAEVLAGAPLAEERLRLAPIYDFREPPHAGELWYERMGWGVNGAEWRRSAAEALAGFSPSLAC
jgi:LmbE family N-acetylglucosaminyl deacetylase